jgi:hypothetical protein
MISVKIPEHIILISTEDFPDLFFLTYNKLVNPTPKIVEMLTKFEDRLAINDFVMLDDIVYKVVHTNLSWPCFEAV